MYQTPIDRRGLSLITLAHILTDLNQGAIPALIPFIVAKEGLNYFGAAGITVASTLISSVLQPLLGFSSDHKPMSWLIPVGMFVGGTGLAFSGWMPRYEFVLAAILLCGVGVAAFHPEAYRFANYYSRGQKATGMSIFTVGGNVGFALGPLALTFCVLHWGLTGTGFLILPAALMAGIYILEQPRLRRLRQEEQGATQVKGTSNWRAFSLLLGIIVARSMAYYCLSTFVPLYLIKYRGFQTSIANSSLTLMAVASIFGALVGGALADRWGHRRTLFTLALGITASILLFVVTTGWLPFLFLVVVSGCLAASFTISMVMGQYYGRGNLGLASGLTTGLAIGLGGISAPIFGIMADWIGLPYTLSITAGLPFFAALAVLYLPKDFAERERNEL
ncbi:MAG: MFS transporter [Chloroflexota bacterium]